MQASRKLYKICLIANKRESSLRLVFEIIDDAGQVRAYVASHVRREADRLIVRHRETEVGIDIARSATGARRRR